MNIVVDTNIVFSAIIYDKGKIGELLLNKPANIKYTSPDFLLHELNQHTKKLLKLTGYSETEYQQIKSFVTKNIEFIDPNKIDNQYWDLANNMLNAIDPKDAPFLALNLQMNGLLWTGDKRLIQGLNHNNYDNVITTDILYANHF